MSEVLVVNAGSSSLKYSLVDPDGSGEPLARGLVERIGDRGSSLRHSPSGGPETTTERDLPTHREALALVLEAFEAGGRPLESLVGVGHRVVHGGTRFPGPVVVDDRAEADIEELTPLAPLHNPPQLAGIRALRRLMPDVPQVAVFDTSFHTTIPAVASTYALPADLTREHGLRRYGFHGTSHRYVSRVAAQTLGLAAEEADLVVAHIGNGASITAVAGGRSVDTSMGLTPLEGLVMGTRSGDVDPGVVFFLVRELGMGAQEVDDLLNRRSGLKGMCGESDVRRVRELADGGDDAAALALEVYAYRIRKYVGAYLAVVPGVRALVFTAGVGENDARTRAAVCGPLAHLGIRLDDAANAAAVGPREPVVVDDGAGGVRVLVVPTDEEAEIARETLRLVGG